MTAAGALTVTAHLRTCSGCGRWAHSLAAATGLCRDCRLGWARCIEHGRLEHERSDHQRVSVTDVLLAVPIPTAATARGGTP